MGDMSYSTDYHMDRGTQTHKTIELYLKGSLDEDTLDPILRPYLEGFKRFMADTGFVVHGGEVPMYDRTYKYAGTPDLWGMLNGKNTLLDIKTGVPAAWHSVQLGAYWSMLDYNITQAGCLYLSDDGNYRLSEMLTGRELPIQSNLFTCALSNHNWKKENLK